MADVGAGTVKYEVLLKGRKGRKHFSVERVLLVDEQFGWLITDERGPFATLGEAERVARLWAMDEAATFARQAATPAVEGE